MELKHASRPMGIVLVVKLPRRAGGYTFTSLPPNAAQTFRLRGRHGTTTIRFDYRVPNG
jgi:hypothetical protein